MRKANITYSNRAIRKAGRDPQYRFDVISLGMVPPKHTQQDVVKRRSTDKKKVRPFHNLSATITQVRIQIPLSSFLRLIFRLQLLAHSSSIPQFRAKSRTAGTRHLQPRGSREIACVSVRSRQHANLSTHTESAVYADGNERN